MSAVAMKTKTSSWSTMFPNEIKTKQQSLVFMKKLFAVAVSNIVYLRAIFPEHAFFDKELEGLSLKILREDSKYPGAAKVISWVRGCFDALDKNYLKSVIIGIFTDPEDPDTVIESYTFKFTYSDSSVSVDVDTENNKNVTNSASSSIAKEACSHEEIKGATVRLLRTMLMAGNTLDHLPNDVMVTMKLLYHDDVTPVEYEPCGFKTTDYAGFRHQAESLNVRIGSVKTEHHSFRMLLQTDKENFTEKYLSKKSTLNSGSVSDTVSKSAQLGTPSPAGANSSAIHAATPGSTGNARSATQASPNEDDEEFTVRCPCGANTDDGIMIMCEECKIWQHALCFNIIDENNTPEIHICDECAILKPELLTNGVTDRKLLLLDTDERQIKECEIVRSVGNSLGSKFYSRFCHKSPQSICLFRRSLLACLNMANMTPSQLAKKLDVEIGIGQGLVTRLEEEGVLITTQGRRGKRQGKSVNKEHLEEIVIPKFFESEADQPKDNTDDLEEEMDVLTDKTNEMVIKPGSSSHKRKLQEQPHNIEEEFDLAELSQPSPPSPKRQRRACVARTPVALVRF